MPRLPSPQSCRYCRRLPPAPSFPVWVVESTLDSPPSPIAQRHPSPQPPLEQPREPLGRDLALARAGLAVAPIMLIEWVHSYLLSWSLVLFSFSLCNSGRHSSKLLACHSNLNKSTRLGLDWTGSSRNYKCLPCHRPGSFLFFQFSSHSQPLRGMSLLVEDGWSSIVSVVYGWSCKWWLRHLSQRGSLPIDADIYWATFKHCLTTLFIMCHHNANAPTYPRPSCIFSLLISHC